MGFGNILKMITGIVMGGFGLLMILGTVVSNKFSLEADLLFFILLGIAPTLGGLWFCYSSVKDRGKLKGDKAEKEILKLAERAGGVLSVAQVTTYTSLTSSEAEAMLNRMQEKGLAEIKISDRGIMFYEFAGMQTPKQFID